MNVRSLITVLILGATPSLALMAGSRAEEQESDVPSGYEDARQVGEPEDSAKGDAPPNDGQEADDKKSDTPAGYEAAAQAGGPQQKARKRFLAQPAPVAIKEIFAKNAQLMALADQMRPVLQPLFAAELTFAKMVCKPNAAQFKQMKDQAAPEFETAILMFAKHQAPNMGIRIMGGNRFQQQQSQDIFHVFEAATNRIVSNVFPAETAEIYQTEQNHRKEFRARSGAMALVAHLDTRFRLSRTQREQLTDSLQQVWRDAWQHYLQVMTSNPQFFPPVPDASILPYLNPAQAKQWRATQRHNLGVHWQNLNQNQFIREMKPEIEWFEKRDKNAGRAGKPLLQPPAAVVDVLAVDEVLENIDQAKVQDEAE